jgi:hypothetical protein
MKYISGVHALNLKCNLVTCGDWHTYALTWDNPKFYDSEENFFGDYGIETDRPVPMIRPGEKFNVANHIRAVLDLIQNGDFSNAGGMNSDYICNDIYDTEIFGKVSMLKSSPLWAQIDKFMEHEYRMKWVRYRNAKI